MKSVHSILLAILLSASPTIANASIAVVQSLARGDGVVVKNNSSERLSCSVSYRGESWSDYFELTPGAEWDDPYESDRVFFYCQRPVEQRVYRVVSANRYIFLREEDGEIRLYNIAAQ